MPAPRGVKRSASKASSTATASAAPKNKKKRGVTQLELPSLPLCRGQVFSCGQNDVGQLGLGENVPETNKFKPVSLLGHKIAIVQAGGMHTVAIDYNGNVWTFGCNDEGALGRPTSSDEEEGTPTMVQLPTKAVSVSAGDSHTAALCDDGNVFAWGAFRDSHGSMGLLMSGREGKTSRTPVQVPIGEPAVAVASGQDHLVILSASGSMYTLGCGEQGQLGRLAQRSASRDARAGFSALLTPSKVTLKATISHIWAGYHATFALDASGEKMYAFGLNNYGQLGITGEKHKSAIFTPVECDAFNALGVRWVAVSCGQHHSLALGAAGQVYAVGRCEYGRLGLGEGAGDAEAPVQVPLPQHGEGVCIACGTSNSFATTKDGALYAWGMGSEGQLGVGTSVDRAAPTHAPVPAGVCRAVAAGGQHTVLLVEDPSRPASPPAPPQAETSTQNNKAAAVDNDDDEEMEQEKPKTSKRQRKEPMEDEVSSTSEQSTATKRKVNGDDKGESLMEVDETESTKSQDAKETDKKEEIVKKDEITNNASPEKTDSTVPIEKTTNSEPEITQNDVEMNERVEEKLPEKTEGNGVKKPEIVKEKSVEKIVEKPVEKSIEKPVDTDSSIPADQPPVTA